MKVASIVGGGTVALWVGTALAFQAANYVWDVVKYVVPGGI